MLRGHVCEGLGETPGLPGFGAPRHCQSEAGSPPHGVHLLAPLVSAPHSQTGCSPAMVADQALPLDCPKHFLCSFPLIGH